MSLPGYGDVYVSADHCGGGACPHDHPEPVCEQCGSETDVEPTYSVLETVWLCPSCGDVPGADEWQGGAA